MCRSATHSHESDLTSLLFERLPWLVHTRRPQETLVDVRSGNLVGGEANTRHRNSPRKRLPGLGTLVSQIYQESALAGQSGLYSLRSISFCVISACTHGLIDNT